MKFALLVVIYFYSSAGTLELKREYISQTNLTYEVCDEINRALYYAGEYIDNYFITAYCVPQEGR